MNGKFVFVVLLILAASILPDIVLNLLAVNVPAWMTPLKLLILAGLALLSLFIRALKQLTKFIVVLAVIIATQLLITSIASTFIWKSAFNNVYFIDNFGGSILLKLISLIPIIATLYLLLGSTKEFFLCKGELSVKASKIAWIGIDDNSISWGKLSVISALLITIGTALLTVFTVTNLSTHKDIFQLLKYLPVIIVMAVLNSFCEGIVYRSAVLGTLKNVMPKNQVIIAAALFFGIGHYYGAPGGFVGILMSSLLGWYMCRSMYETKGFAASWIIHCMQDVVIFSTIFLMGNYI